MGGPVQGPVLTNICTGSQRVQGQARPTCVLSPAQGGGWTSWL